MLIFELDNVQITGR